MEAVQERFVKESRALVETKQLTKPPSLQEVINRMEAANAYVDIFPEIFKLINILLTLPLGTATVER